MGQLAVGRIGVEPIEAGTLLGDRVDGRDRGVDVADDL